MTPSNNALQIIAKWDDANPGVFHPLIYHMMDVAACASVLWDEYLSVYDRKHLANTLGITEDQAHYACVLLIGLHDIGKCWPEFQSKNAHTSALLQAGGLSTRLNPKIGTQSYKAYCDDQKSKHASFRMFCKHQNVSSVYTAKLLNTSILNMTAKQNAKLLARIPGSHHGLFMTSADYQSVESEMARQLVDDPNKEWDAIRLEIVQLLVQFVQKITGYSHAFTLNFDKDAESSFLVILARMTVFADWLGSDSDVFKFAHAMTYNNYTQESIRLADTFRAVLKFPPKTVLDIDATFSHKKLNNLQDAIVNCANSPGASFSWAEYPMGGGKTIAALCLADKLMSKGAIDGLYFLLPTQATANGIFEVINQFADGVGINSPILAHGLASKYKKKRKAKNSYYNYKFSSRNMRVFGQILVGTIDQLLMGGLKTKRWFTRLPSNKLIIIDEAHTYNSDPYMLEIILRILPYLRQLNNRILILSATMPESLRQRMLNAYWGISSSDADVIISPTQYPSLSHSESPTAPTKAVHFPVTKDQQRTVQIHRINDDVGIICQDVLDAISFGGHAAVIVNTVDKAQEIYRQLKRTASSDTELSLFHARFISKTRAAIESKTMSKYGDKTLTRPGKSILVATQVVEQSLDVDFDYMVTEIAPIDLVLQRLGRLHRHTHNRPTLLSVARCGIIVNDIRADVAPSFGKNAYVYSKYHLLRSAWILGNLFTGKSQIILPDDINPLVQLAYGDTDAQRWALDFFNARSTMDFETQQKIATATSRIIPSVHSDMTTVSNECGIEYIDSSGDLKNTSSDCCITRDGAWTINVICLELFGKNATYPYESDPGFDYNMVIDSTNNAHRDLVNKISDNMVRISHHNLVSIIDGMPDKKEWKDSMLLRYAKPLIFTNIGGVLTATLSDSKHTYILTLDEELGVVISKI